MHGKLYEVELNRIRWISHVTALLFEEIAGKICAGMEEDEVARLLHASLILQGIQPEVIITGSDERITKYWHALPSSKKIERYALVHGASSRWGLHANVNRLIAFGEPPQEIRRAHEAAAVIEAKIIGMLQPGVSYAHIHAMQKQWYAELGYGDDWKFHFQGGPTGYYLGDATRCFTEMKVEDDQAFDWFITVGGVQVEELTLLSNHQAEVASKGESWPQFSVTTDTGKNQRTCHIYKVAAQSLFRLSL